MTDMDKETKEPSTTSRRGQAGRIAAAVIIAAVVVFLLLEFQEFAHLRLQR